jgi:hypothetical protein
MSNAGLAPIVAVWSPSWVIVYDPASRQTVAGRSLAEVVSNGLGGRDLIVGISQRNTFVRTLPAPNVARVELARIISFKLVPLLPGGGQEYVSGFRVGGGSHGEARVAVVGAVRAELLKAVHADAKHAGLSVKAVLPFAFASWLLARNRSLPSCAVVDAVGESLSIDIVVAGELRHSRSIPFPETDEEFQDELERTFRIAESEPLPVLAVGGVRLPADYTDPHPLATHFADLSAIQKSLFSLEPLETTIAREARVRRAVAGRAIVAAAAAIVLGAYVALQTHGTLIQSADRLAADTVALGKARDATKLESGKYQKVHDSFLVIDKAFHPAQKFSDVIRVMATSSSPKSWFTGLTLERGKLVLIRGNALDGKTVAKYVADLDQDKRFRGMKLVFWNKATIAKKAVFQFAISGRVVGNLPLDEVPKQVRHA